MYNSAEEFYYELNPLIPVNADQLNELNLFSVVPRCFAGALYDTCLFRVQNIVDTVGWEKAKKIDEIKGSIELCQNLKNVK